MREGNSYFSQQRDDSYIYPGLLQPNIFSQRLAVLASSTQIDLLFPCGIIIVFPELDNVFINWANGTATSSNAMIAKGTSCNYQGLPIRFFTYLGATATGFINIMGW